MSTHKHAITKLDQEPKNPDTPGACPPDYVRELSHAVPVAQDLGGHRMHRGLEVEISKL